MAVRNRFYVGLYDWAADIVVAWPRLLLLFLLKDGLSIAAAMKGSTAIGQAANRSSKVLPWTYRISCFGEIVYFTFLLKYKCHKVIFIIIHQYKTQPLH